jgi:hypothetical protein
MVTMSQKEFQRVKVIENAAGGRLSVREASRLLQLSERQVQRLKPDAPRDALDTIAKNLVVPLLEKQLADGAIHEYEIDTEAIHTEAPGTFFIVYIAANAEGLDKVNAAVQAAVKASPFSGPAFGSMTESAAHRDGLYRTTATFK